MTFKEKFWRDAFELDYLYRIDGRFLLVMVAAKKEFDSYSQGKCDLKNYTVWLNLSKNREFANISFIPNTNGRVCFEISDKEKNKYAQGYDFYFRLENAELLEVVEI